MTTVLIISFLIGLVAGLRAFLAPAAVSWAAYAGRIEVPGGFAFLAHYLTPWILSTFAVVELVADQLPTTPSRKVPFQFGTRIVMAAVSGAAMARASDLVVAGCIAGIVGCLVGTLGGASARRQLAVALGNDHPAAFAEDAVSLALAAILLWEFA